MKTILGAKDVFYLLFVLFCVACAFCEFGVWMFGSNITKVGSDGTAIYNSVYGGSPGYWPLNFNDYFSGLVTLFTLLTVSIDKISSNFHVEINTMTR